MTDIADFLRARIAERRALAEAAAEDSEVNWSPGDEHLGSSVSEETSGAAVVIGPWDHLDWGVRRYIAAHDPAAVIADCDAKLAIIGEVFIYEAKTDGEWGCSHDAEAIAAGLCPETAPSDITALRLLAQPFAGHPDYKGEEWAP